MNLDDLDGDRPDRDCEPQPARGIPRNLQLDETQRYASAQLAGRMPPMFRSVLARVRPGAGPAWRSDPSPVLQLRRNRRTIRRAQARQPKRVDTMQVVRALTAPGYERRRRPVAAMWAGHAEALLHYALDACTIGCERGHAKTCATLVADLAGDYSDSVSPPAGTAGGRRNPSGVGRAGVSPKESSRAGSAESRTRSAILSFEVPAHGADGVSTR